VFDNQQWICLKQVWALVLRTLRKWRLIFKDFMLTKKNETSRGGTLRYCIKKEEL
jgi:hypothetical protein